MLERITTMLYFRRLAAISTLGFLALTTAAHAAQLVVNGSFSSTTNGPGQLDYITEATGWTNDNYRTGYNFIFSSGSADTTGVSSQYGPDDLELWGPGNGSNNGLPASSPDGGNYMAMDG